LSYGPVQEVGMYCDKRAAPVKQKSFRKRLFFQRVGGDYSL